MCMCARVLVCIVIIRYRSLELSVIFPEIVGLGE